MAYTEDRGFKVTEILRTDTTGCWNEMETRDFVNDSVILNTVAGEVEAMYPVALALSRKVGDREQRIMILEMRIVSVMKSFLSGGICG